MTFHRFIYKVLWRSKVIALLIFACAVIAMVTALFHGGLVSSSGQFAQPQHKSRIQAREHRHEHAHPNPDEIETRGFLMHPLKDVHLQEHFKRNDKQIMQQYVEEAKKKALDVLKLNKGNFNVNGNGRRAVGEKNNEIHNKIIQTSTIKSKTRKGNRTKDSFKPYHSKTLSYNSSQNVEIFDLWRRSKESFCDGKMLGFFNEFAQFEDVIFDKKFCHGRKGGEDIHEVLLQAEELEYYTFDLGCLQMACENKPSYFFNNKNHLNDLMFSLKTKALDASYEQHISTGFNILVTRYEYANIYHTMTDWYAAFLLMNFFNKTQSETNILLVDGHPIGALDPVWPVLFNSTVRLSDLKPRTKFDHLTFNILGYNTHFLDHSTDSIPLLEEFQKFFLHSYHINNDKKLNCDKISVLFIWRRDYVAHPRNPKGEVSRKIDNEKELIDFMQSSYPKYHFKGVQIDLFEMQHQLKYVSEADILIGMHGAGLTHALFLPKHGGLIELIPRYWSAANEHFLAIARWRNLKYERWVNTDLENEAPNKHTKIPTYVLNLLFRSMLQQMGCLPRSQESLVHRNNKNLEQNNQESVHL